MSRLLIIAVTILLAGLAQAKTFYASKDRTIYVTGEVHGGILAQAAQVELLSKSGEDITLIVNSPGGSVATGLQFISAMRVAQQRGVEFNCFVPMLAASMAMLIYNECDNRYALRTALFLWHPIRIFLDEAVTPEIAEALRDQMTILSMDFNSRMIKALGIPAKVYYHYYYNEMFLTGLFLKGLSSRYLTLVDDFVGVERPYAL